MSKVSVVVPCFNEEAVLPRLFERLGHAASSWSFDFEVVCVDDGSRDATWELLRQQHTRDPRWRALSLARNFGHQAAVSAGLEAAVGDAVVVMDADLQDPPEEIARLLTQWQQGYDVVYAVRQKRKEGLGKRLTYWLFYRLLARLVSFDIPLDSGDFCLMSRRVVDCINAMPERNRFVRGLRAWAGFRQIGLPYERAARDAGRPKYGPRRLIKLALDGVFAFSTVPLRMATYLGWIVSTFAFLGAAFELLQRVFLAQLSRFGFKTVPGFPTLVITILFIGGVQLVCLGILGEYIGRIYDEVKRRPNWIVREHLGPSSPTRPERRESL